MAASLVSFVHFFHKVLLESVYSGGVQVLLDNGLLPHTWMWEKPRETKTKDLMSGAVCQCLEFLTQRGTNHTTITPFPGSGTMQTHSID